MNYGVLYLCATPIGNLEDITFRVLRILKEVRVIACEDTRRTQKLCSHYGVTTPLTSYHEHNERVKSDELIRLLLEGDDIALVSDAGTPGISDPGQIIVCKAIEAGIEVVPVPGACAAIAALTASGLDTGEFAFVGFLPREKKKREEKLKNLQHYPRTLVFYVSPHRFQPDISAMRLVLGDRKVAIAREISKMHEEFIRTTLHNNLLAQYEPKGEMCLIVEGAPEHDDVFLADLPLQEHIEFYLQSGSDRKEAIKRVARDRDVGKREVYRQLLELEGKL